ncbi:MAG: tRNA uridine(34) 5-carboxymethylaminomethyl modification radical SAM/GNAT enzyme Elp3 [Proteobacteria bacterium]|nr:tRNA uridine(34) 5-carboxymethylaminomethyl modification radical SAM/GNAT enzyme Elp3 [Pseudomonadota bacterium]
MRGFQPVRHERELRSILNAIERLPADAELDGSALDPILRKYPRDGKGFFSRSELIAGFEHLREREGLGHDAEALARRLRLRPVRTRSGVTPLTVLTQPYPCPGRCVFCPNDVRMPKSYLADEPGAQRAAANRFDPYLQAWNRLDAYRAIGHPTDKVELIVLGGTWSFYPEPYQVWFATRLFEALNDFGAGLDRRAEAWRSAPDFAQLPAPLDGRRLVQSYNQVVSGFLDRHGAGVASGDADWCALARVQRANETAGSRSVGLVLETRPDHVDEAEVLRLRRLGCTKVQVGIQSLSDEVLRANRRGHDVAATRQALGLLRRAGFKIHAHWMPNLLAATPAADGEDFGRLFDDPAFRPDELKIYPCSLVESAELMTHFESGHWRPYTHDELLDVLVAALAAVPRYCRLTRVIRDISSDDIVVGNKLTNFREVAERALAERGGACVDIRSREIGARSFTDADLELGVMEYETDTGRELFLELATREDRLAGFARLSLPAAPSFVEELGASALLREVHVYGPSLAIGASAGADAQHRGLGARLVRETARRAGGAGYRNLAVISAVGTRPYYRRLGFRDGELYQHLAVGEG